MGDTSHAVSLPLRIYYTKSASPQYILARSHKKYPVSLIPRQSSPVFHYASTLPVQQTPILVPSEESSCVYATISLKACLDTICCTSPEIVQDASRDYSVYVLDPLESQSTPAPVNIPSDSLSPPEHRSTFQQGTPAVEQQPLVAVGLGLMSWALLVEERDSVPVTGTVLKLASGQEVLQVIFALREALPIQKAALPEALRAWGLPPPPSKRSQVHASRSHPHSKYPSSSNSRNSHSGHRHVAHFNKHFSPPASTSQNHPTQSERILDSSTVYIGPPKRKVGRPAGADSQSKSNKLNKSLVGTSPVTPAEHAIGANGSKANDNPSQDANVPKTESSLLQILANLSSSGQNTALLSVLSAIDSQDQGTTNPALVDALKQLLSVVNTIPEPSLALATPPQPSLHKKERSPADDDIVILDKENVNPTAFRRRTNKEEDKFSAIVPNTDRPTPLGNKGNSSPLATTTALRKRRLSDFMDERDRERAGSRSKALGQVDFTPPQRQIWSDSAPASFTRPSISQQEQQNHHHHTASGRSVSIPRPGPSDENSAQRHVAGPATSPARMPKRRAVPEWARTTTATQPRLSKEAEEQQKEKAQETKRKKMKTTRKDGKVERQNVRRCASDVAPSTSRRTKEALEAPIGGRPSNTLFSGQASSAVVPPRPVMASSSGQLPIFASDLSLPSSSPPPSSPSPPSPRELPQTPTRKDGPRSPFAYKDSSDICSLFTPTPKSWTSDPSRRLSELLGGNSPLCSPSFVSAFGKTWPVLTGSGDERGDGAQDKQGEELDEDLEFPPSSLPIASSDVDIDSPQHDHDNSRSEPAFTQDSMVQHWAGLPPSSPPPPTSSPLIAQDLLTDMFDLDEQPPISAIPTPDSDPFPRNYSSVPDEPQQGAHETSFDELSCLFSDPAHGDLQLADVFAHFPNNNNTQDQNRSQEGMEVASNDIQEGVVVALQNGLVDFDFTEFWQSVKPLVGPHDLEGYSEDVLPSSQHDDSILHMPVGEIDHSRLAAEVQALFSGCLM